MDVAKTPSTIVFLQDASDPNHWVFELAGLMPMPLAFWHCDALLRHLPAVQRTRAIGHQYHIWLTGQDSQAWSFMIRPLLVFFLSAVFDWKPQPTPHERRLTKPMAQIL